MAKKQAKKVKKVRAGGVRKHSKGFDWPAPPPAGADATIITVIAGTRDVPDATD